MRAQMRTGGKGPTEQKVFCLKGGWLQCSLVKLLQVVLFFLHYWPFKNVSQINIEAHVLLLCKERALWDNPASHCSACLCRKSSLQSWIIHGSSEECSENPHPHTLAHKTRYATFSHTLYRIILLFDTLLASSFFGSSCFIVNFRFTEAAFIFAVFSEKTLILFK